eukprot:2131930-Prymnesium_polylepis.1
MARLIASSENPFAINSSMAYSASFKSANSNSAFKSSRVNPACFRSRAEYASFSAAAVNSPAL